MQAQDLESVMPGVGHGSLVIHPVVPHGQWQA